MADDFKLEGIEALSAKLKDLSFDVKHKGGRAALRKAANVIALQAKENARRLNDPATKESIEANIVPRWSARLFRRTGDLGFRIGVLGGARNMEAYGEIQTGKNASENPGGDTWYWRLLEFGTSKMAARPFMRPAIEQSKEKAVNTFLGEFDKALDRALKKTKK